MTTIRGIDDESIRILSRMVQAFESGQLGVLNPSQRALLGGFAIGKATADFTTPSAGADSEERPTGSVQLWAGVSDRNSSGAIWVARDTVTAYDWGGLGLNQDDRAILARLEMAKATRWIVLNGHTTYKPFIDFTLDAALATTEATKAATIVTEYGVGRTQPTSSITVRNLSKNGGDFVFEGDSGDYGRGLHSTGTEYLIANMECP